MAESDSSEASSYPRPAGFSVARSRPLPVVILADVSGSMKADGKISALNNAMREMIASFAEEDELPVEIQVAVITFGKGGARLHLPLCAGSTAVWNDMEADGKTPMGAAIDLATSLMEDRTQMPARAYRPTLVLVSDGVPMAGWEGALSRLEAAPRASKAIRFAISIGADADLQVLRRFAGGSAESVYPAEDGRRIRKFFLMLTMTVRARSRSMHPDESIPLPPPESVEIDI